MKLYKRLSAEEHIYFTLDRTHTSLYQIHIYIRTLKNCIKSVHSLEQWNEALLLSLVIHYGLFTHQHFCTQQCMTYCIHTYIPTTVSLLLNTASSSSLGGSPTSIFFRNTCCPNVNITRLNSEETTQLRRKATWEKGLTTEPQTRDLCSNAEFLPRKPRNQPRSFVPHRRLCASHRVSYTIHLGLAGRLRSSIQVPASRSRVLSGSGFGTPVTDT